MAVRLEHIAVQDDWFNDDDGPTAFVAGLGLGKTMCATDKIMKVVAQYPKSSPYIFSNTYDQLRSGTLDTFFKRLDAVWVPGDKRFEYVNKMHHDKFIYFPKLGAKIGVRSVDKEINWKSLELTTAWIDEAQAWDKAAYDMVLGRLRGTDLQRRLYPNMPLQPFITANPPHTHNHWLYELTHEPDPLTGKPPIRLYTGTTYDNPFLPNAYIERMEAMYDPDIARAELLGEFINIGKGKVFRRFNREKHFIDDKRAAELGLPALKYDPSLPLCWSHDFNLDPLASVLFQWRKVNVKGYQKTVMFVYDVIRIESALISDAPKELLNRTEAAKLAQRNGIVIYGDSSGLTQSNRQTGRCDFDELRIEMKKLGFRGEMKVSSANPTHRDSSASANRMLEDSNGDIGVVIVKGRETLWLVLDAEKMTWKPGTDSFDIQKPKPGEVIPNAKKLTHCADAWRYPIHFEFPIVEHIHNDYNLAR